MVKILLFILVIISFLYFLIRTVINSDPSKISKFIRISLSILILLAVLFFLTRGNLSFLSPLISIGRKLLMLGI